MNNFPAFALLIAFPTAALLLAGLVIVGCLVAAALYARGHPSADRLRAFAGRLPRLVARGVMHFEGFAFVLVLAIFTVLTVVFS